MAFFSRQAAKPRSFWAPRINTESHGFFYVKVFFLRLRVFARDLSALSGVSFCFAHKTSFGEELVREMAFFSREAAKPRSFWEPRINTESHGFFYGKIFFLRLRVFARDLSALSGVSFCFAHKTSFGEEPVCERLFFSRKAAKPRSFFYLSKALRLRVFAREALLCPRKKILLCTGTLCYENFFPFAQTSR